MQQQKHRYDTRAKIKPLGGDLYDIEYTRTDNAQKQLDDIESLLYMCQKRGYTRSELLAMQAVDFYRIVRIIEKEIENS